MDAEIEWMAVPDVADKLGVPLTHVRELLRERRLLAVRKGENSAWYMPAMMIAETDGTAVPLPTLHGTLTLLNDAGFADDEAMEWLLTVEAELGEAPLAALADGRRAHVRRVAQALL